jgi:hypothetical protein
LTRLRDRRRGVTRVAVSRARISLRSTRYVVQHYFSTIVLRLLTLLTDLVAIYSYRVSKIDPTMSLTNSYVEEDPKGLSGSILAPKVRIAEGVADNNIVSKRDGEKQIIFIPFPPY